ncbi:oligosaccharide flippase family protein [Alsobacter sp. SYSU BS001988]
MTAISTEAEAGLADGAARKGRVSAGGTLLGANLLEAILPFLRNIALARLIAPDQFGLAISLSVVLGMIEVITDFGLPIFAVSKTTTASDDEIMPTLQSLALLRAAAIGAVLAAASPLVAQLFGAGDKAWVYALLGVIALLRGFNNLGPKECMRHYVFWREATVISSTQTVWAVVTVALAALQGGFECMIWGMLAATVAEVALTHGLSPRPYRLGWNANAAQDASRFGRPLLVNGMAVSLAMGDRLLVGSLLGPAALALYNVAYGTATLPRSVLSKFLNSMFVPIFTNSRAQPERLARVSDLWAWLLSALGCFYGLGLALLGDEVLGLVFGAHYRPTRLFMCLAGMSVFVKFMMMLPVPAAYASGRTRLVSLGSIMSACAVAPAGLILILTRDLDAFLLAIVAAEFGAAIIYARWALRAQAFTPRVAWLCLGAPLAPLAALALLAWAAPQLARLDWAMACFGGVAAAAAFYGAVAVMFRIDFRTLLH